jgi:hypothetical protein
MARTTSFEAEEEQSMLAARATQDIRLRLKAKIDARLNAYLCEMKESCDDAITGFNEAWDLVREIFAEEAKKD